MTSLHITFQFGSCSLKTNQPDRSPSLDTPSVVELHPRTPPVAHRCACSISVGDLLMQQRHCESFSFGVFLKNEKEARDQRSEFVA